MGYYGHWSTFLLNDIDVIHIHHGVNLRQEACRQKWRKWSVLYTKTTFGIKFIRCVIGCWIWGRKILSQPRIRPEKNLKNRTIGHQPVLGFLLHHLAYLPKPLRFPQQNYMFKKWPSWTSNPRKSTDPWIKPHPRIGSNQIQACCHT